MFSMRVSLVTFSILLFSALTSPVWASSRNGSLPRYVKMLSTSSPCSDEFRKIYNSYPVKMQELQEFSKVPVVSVVKNGSHTIQTPNFIREAKKVPKIQTGDFYQEMKMQESKKVPNVYIRKI